MLQTLLERWMVGCVQLQGVAGVVCAMPLSIYVGTRSFVFLTVLHLGSVVFVRVVRLGVHQCAVAV